MAVNYDPALHILQPHEQAGSASVASGGISLAPDPQPYPHDMTAQLMSNLSIPSPSLSEHTSVTADSTQSPSTGRLAGEPAYCSGRHCCQWAVGGYVCNNHYASAADLDHHVATDHAGRLPNRQPSGDYHCHWAGCSKSDSFGNKPKLTRHIHSHTGHKPHSCPYPGCGKGFVTKEQLKNHETTHTKTKEHICPECGKGFAVKTALTSHMNVHKGAKPYQCEECGKGFADSSNLSKHKAIHKRVTARRHRHHAHRASVSTTASSSVFSPSPLHNSSRMEFEHFHMPIPSVETGVAPADYMQPCYDNYCPRQLRVPCRSVSPCRAEPCRNRDCSPTTVGHCEVPCDLGDCEPCVLPECDSCDLPHCDLGDCTEDCIDPFCVEQYNTDLCFPSDQTFKPSGNAMMMYPHDSLGGLQVACNTAGDSLLGNIEDDGFKQLRDFIAEDFGHPQQSHQSHIR